MENETPKQKIITFATSEHYAGAIELLKKCRTQLTTVIGTTEYLTLVNALTLEIESNLIQWLVVAVDKIRNGEQILDEQ